MHKPGRQNSATDSLSRKTDTPILQTISSPQMELWEDLQAANKIELYFVELIQRLQEKSAQMQNFSQRDGHLLFKGQFVINPTCSLKSTLLQEFHNSKIGGHSWVLCTFKRLSQVFHWIAMKKDVETYVSSCEVCQKNKNDCR